MSKQISIVLLNTIFKIIGFFLPVKKRVLFLGSPRNKTLMENGQLVYDALTCNKKVITKPVPHSIFDIAYISFYIMTSKVIVLDDHYRYFVYIPLKKNQKLVQMYHGPGAFKKVALELPGHPPIEKYYHDQYDAFITSSPDVYDHFESCFGIKKEVIKPLGYPLSDLLINNEKNLKTDFYKKYPEMKDKTIILYLPTYRRYEHDDLLDFDYGINWDELDEYLKQSNSLFLVKRHPLQIHNNIQIVPKEYENIIDLGDVPHLTLLAGSNVLITDYSSAFFDFLMLDRPIIFYCPDTKEYLEKNGIYFNFPEDLPGYYCETSSQLIETLKNIDYNVDYGDFKKKYMGSCDGHSTEKVAKLIEDYYNN